MAFHVMNCVKKSSISMYECMKHSSNQLAVAGAASIQRELVDFLQSSTLVMHGCGAMGTTTIQQVL
jgi:hypothetical protein